MSYILKRPIERLAYRRDEAAAVVGVSPSKFDDWVARGLMPKPIKCDGCTLFDAQQLSVAWQSLRDRNSEDVDNNNPYDNC
jgi:hypothetical protein